MMNNISTSKLEMTVRISEEIFIVQNIKILVINFFYTYSGDSGAFDGQITPIDHEQRRRTLPPPVSPRVDF